MTEEHGEDEPPRAKRNFFSIDIDMIPCKLAFFFNSVGLGSVFPFLNVFYVSSGLTAQRAGLCSGIENCFSMIAVPLWGAVIDSTRHRKLLLIIVVVATALTKFSKPWIVYFISETETTVICAHNQTNSISIHNGTKSNCTTTIDVKNPDKIFYGLVVGGILSSIFYSAVMSFTEGTTVKVIYKQVTKGTKPSYGAQKFFAPIGFAIGSLVAGVAVDNYHPSSYLSHYTAAFYVYLPFKLMLVPILYILICQADWNYRPVRGNGKEAIAVLKNADNALFALTVLVSGLCLRTYTEFVFLFMDRELHTTKTLMSLTMVSAMLSELIVYPFSSKIIRYMGGTIPCLIICLFSYFPRYMMISYVESKWLMLPIQLFHGLGMSLSWAAMVEHTYHIFPKEVTTTALGLIASIFFIISSVITNMAGGVLYHNYGGRHLFRGSAILAGCWSMLMALYFGVKYIKNRSYTNNESNNGIDIDVIENTNQT